MRTIGIVFLFALAGLSCDGPPDSRSAEIPPPTTTAGVSVAYRPVQTPIRPDLGQSIPTPTAPPTTLPATKCAEWYPLAMEVGWPDELWPRLSQIMWRESRCLPDAHFDGDPNGGSYGLMQINGFWCRPRYAGDPGWLQAAQVLDTCDELYDPETVLEASLHVYVYSLYQNKNGWHPWRT